MDPTYRKGFTKNKWRKYQQRKKKKEKISINCKRNISYLKKNHIKVLLRHFTSNSYLKCIKNFQRKNMEDTTKNYMKHVCKFKKQKLILKKSNPLYLLVFASTNYTAPGPTLSRLQGKYHENNWERSSILPLYWARAGNDNR